MPVTQLTIASFDAALKQLYTPQAIHNLVYSDNPLFAMIAKMTSFEGRNLPIVLEYSNPQGISVDFATAKANQSNTSVEDFLLTRVPLNGLASLSNEVIKASGSDKGSFLRAAQTEINNLLKSMGRQLAVACYRDNGGAIGQIADGATLAAVTIALRSEADIANFEKNMYIQFATTASGGSLRDSGASLKIVAIDRSAGTVTFTANVSTITGVADTDFLIVDGNYGSSMSGLAAWIPAVAPGATAFFGVDRSTDTTRLGGVRYDGVGKNIEEALIGGVMKVAREGGKVDKAFCSFSQLENLVNSMGSKVQYVEHKVGEVGFSGIRIITPKGAVDVIGDVSCPDNRTYLLQMNTWKLYSLGPAPHIFDTDGQRMLRQSDADGVEIRANFYGNIGCSAPGWNCVVLL